MLQLISLCELPNAVSSIASGRAESADKDDGPRVGTAGAEPTEDGCEGIARTEQVVHPASGTKASMSSEKVGLSSDTGAQQRVAASWTASGQSAPSTDVIGVSSPLAMATAVTKALSSRDA